MPTKILMHFFYKKFLKIFIKLMHLSYPLTPPHILDAMVTPQV